MCTKKSAVLMKNAPKKVHIIKIIVKPFYEISSVSNLFQECETERKKT